MLWDTSVQAAALTFAQVASWWRWSDWSSPPGGWSYCSSSSSHHQMPGKKELLGGMSQSHITVMTQNCCLCFRGILASFSQAVDVEMAQFFSACQGFVPASSGTFQHWWLWLHPADAWVQSVCPVDQTKTDHVLFGPPPKSIWFQWQPFHYNSFTAL